MTTAIFEKLKLLCIAIPLALSACGGGSSPEPPVPVVDSRSIFTIQIIDERSQGKVTGPLLGNTFDGVGFLLNDNLITVRSPAIYAAKTYAALRSAFEGAVNALKPTTPSLAGVVVTLGPDFTRTDLASDLPVVGQSIVLTDTRGGIIKRSPVAGCYSLLDLIFAGSIFCNLIEGIPASK